MTTHYLIDAYNVIHKSSMLRPIAEFDLERARDMLLDVVQCFCLMGDYQVTVVFDGRRENQTTATNAYTNRYRKIHLVYSPHTITADTVIERLVYKERNRMNCVVVSNDRSLRALCQGMGALTMEADNFLESVKHIQQAAQNFISKRNKSKALLLEDQLSLENLQMLQLLRNRLDGSTS